MRPVRLVFVAMAFLGACGGDGSDGANTVSPTEKPDASRDAADSPEELDGGSVPDGAPLSCAPIAAPACDAQIPAPGPARDFRHTINKIAAAAGAANHRGRDLFLNPGYPQWIMARFAYGAALAEKRATDEEVDVWLNRGCGQSWEKLGTTLTTETPAHAPIEGVEDETGRIFFQIPANKALEVGRHRVRLVMGADLSAAELAIEVVAPNTPVFVSDVDGTLTTSESVEFTSLLTGGLSPANDGAAEALTVLASKGYRPMYLTARPEWLLERTREFVRDRGFPPGIIHTTLAAGLPSTGAAAIQFKSGELANLAGKGLKPAWVFGNTDTDSAAYAAAPNTPPDHRIFFQFGELDGGLIAGGRRLESYKTLVPELKGLEPVCAPP